MESRAAFVPRAIFQPDCLIGNSETWETLSRITDSAVVFYAHTSSASDGVRMETPDA